MAEGKFPQHDCMRMEENMAKENMSFLVCCANGAGSSLMMKMTMQKALDKLKIKPGYISVGISNEALNKIQSDLQNGVYFIEYGI